MEQTVFGLGVMCQHLQWKMVDIADVKGITDTRHGGQNCFWNALYAVLEDVKAFAYNKPTTYWSFWKIFHPLKVAPKYRDQSWSNWQLVL